MNSPLTSLAAPAWTAEQLLFLEWLALPRRLRDPKTQKQLALHLGVDDGTLWRWSKLAGWKEALAERVKTGVLGNSETHLAVLDSLALEAGKGSFLHQKLYLEMAGLYNPKGTAIAAALVLFGVDPEDL